MKLLSFLVTAIIILVVIWLVFLKETEQATQELDEMKASESSETEGTTVYGRAYKGSKNKIENINEQHNNALNDVMDNM